MASKRTTTIIRILLFSATLISLYFVPWPIVRAWIKSLPDTIQEQVDKAPDYGFDGIIVYIDQGGKVPAWYTAGTHSRETQEPARADALFKIASVSKLYTALAVTKLASKGQLDLDQSLAHYFPELAHRIEYADEITIKMLVKHRSGIPNFTDINSYWAHPEDNNEERLALILDLPADFAPDTDYAYCNTNYLLLHELIKKVTGQPSFYTIKKEILEPLNLNNTHGSVHDVDLDRVMSGYYVGYAQDLKTNDNDLMLATAQDLGDFLRALNDGSVFNNQEERDLYASLYEFEHTGLIPGYQTIAKYHNELDAVVIQFTNTVDFEGYNWNLSEVMYNKVVKILKQKS
ncbi:serine hydrolase domain-containing protein [Leeuwenhoekiella palythoae]|uniref:Beta-lactamase n=1 Tax=Leeuwenhoekiella palythoae TaxID=573501 RepID=A0A1M5TKT9_9FLAO|nr:serine hydrolase domain-containing protein [Leeuwenhoekiella palythoae]RXG28630.1 beta-lactamase [Leeuwenhoekiella palythoae]SHH51280.1 Beta-lactamase [Leeuwenhoekiella palythoae]